jgi:[ribosomal protein S5]-alanine N-acetyltransferase
MTTTVFTTKRLVVRRATAVDADLFYELWNHPQVMSNVGFPRGLGLTRAAIADQLAQQGETVFDGRLVVVLQATGERLGEAALHRPDADGIAETDVKLLPQFWGHAYGVEVKRGLLDYLFTHTDCRVVQATPNVNNVASIKMQEAVGGVRVAETTYEFPAAMRAYTTPVRAYVYHVRREDWTNYGTQITEHGR